MTTSDNEWERVTTSGHFDFPFFRIREEPTTMHPNVTDNEERLLNYE